MQERELLLEAIKLHFRKVKQQELADDLPSESLALVELGVCSSKNYPCIRGQCEKCPGKTAISSLCEQLEKLAHVTYLYWVTEGSVVKKKQEATGEEMAAILENLMIGTKMRCHIHNIYRQFSELNFLKRNLKENEVILSVNFSKNYQNKQRHEIQSAYFGHENFTLFSAACYFHRAANIESFSSKIDHDFCLVIVPVAVVSNETSHDRNEAFTNNNKLITFVQEINPAVDTFHFWSDGCAGQ